MRSIPIWMVPSIALALSCAEETTNSDLIQIAGVSPQIVEPGDTIQISGRGFPEGLPARVSFQGDLVRAGQAPKRGVEVIVRTQDTSTDTVTLTVNDELENAFCGAGDTATHVLFQGTVSLAFAAGADSLAPISGALKGVKLEVLPRIKSLQANNDKQVLSQQALKFLGLCLVDGGQSDCCSVDAADGRALLAGIKSGDRLVEFDGVPVRSTLDLVPAGRHRTASLSIRRDDSTQVVVRNVDVQGFRWTIPSELAPAFAVLLLAIGLLIGWVSPLRKVFNSLSIRTADGIERLRARHGVRTRWNSGMSAMRSIVADLPLPEFATLKVAQLTSVIAVGGLCGVLAIREELVSGELDLALWWLVSTSTNALGVFVFAMGQQKKRLLQSMMSAGQSILHQVPLLVLIVAAVVVSRSAHLADLVRTQGAWPHNWLFVHDPALAVAALLAMGALVPTAESTGGGCEWGKQSSPVRRTQRHSPGAALLSFVTNQVHLWVQSVLLATLLFGGWAVPGAATAANQNQAIWMLLATMTLLLKSWLIVWGLSAARSLFQRLTYRHTALWMTKFGTPVGLVCGLLACAWAWGIRHWALPWADTVMRWVILSLIVAFLVALLRNALGRIRQGNRAATSNYWI